MQRSTPDSRSISLPTDLRAIFYLLRENACVIAAVTAVAILLGMIYVARHEKIYSATTTIQVEAEEQQLFKSEGRRADEQTEEALRTIEQKLQSPALLLRLSRHEELANDPAFARQIAPTASDMQRQRLLAGKLSVNIRRGTRLIDVTVEDANPALTEKIANLLVTEFVRANSENSAQVSRSAHELLRQEAERLKATLSKSEHSLQQYKEMHRAVSLDEKRATIADRLKELNQKLSAADAEQVRLAADLAQIRQLAGEPAARLLALPSVLSAPEVIEAEKKIREKTAEIAVLGYRYKPEHPKYLEAAAHLTELETSRDQAAAKAAGFVETALQAAEATRTTLAEALRMQESLALEISQIAIPYNALAREVEADRALYDSLVARLKETDVAQGVSPYAIRIVAAALLPDRPNQPGKMAILLLSACSGLALSLSCVLGRHMVDQSFRTVDEAERALGLSAIGAIPRQRGLQLDEIRRLLIEKPHSAVAEAFRGLRSGLLGTGKSKGAKTVLFASAVPGEGKSFCAINCAVAFAQQGLRTLLIDADLRLPTIGRVVLGTATSPGLSELLRGQCTFEAAAHLTNIENLSVLPAGAIVPDPAQLLGNADLPAFLRTAQARFDRILIDTAPVHAVSETIFLVPHVSAVCLVVGAGSTPAAVVERAVKKLRESGANIVGFVLNRLPLRGNFFYHYNAPGYGRDEVYGASARATR